MKRNETMNKDNTREKMAPYKDKSLIIRIIVGFSIVVLTLAIVVAVLANELNKKNVILENGYSSALYDASANLDNIEIKLSKFSVSNSDNQKLLLANDIWRQSQNTANELSSLPIEHSSVINTTRFINQLGDYVYYLGKKINNKQKITDDDLKVVEDFYNNCAVVNQEMKAFLEKMGNTYKIIDHLDSEKALSKKEKFSDNFTKLQKELVDYPELIYDGPYSDAETSRDFKFLADKSEITGEQGAEMIRKMLDNYNILSVEPHGYVADTEDEAIKFLEFTAKINGGRDIYFQISKKGGMPIMMSTVRATGGAAISEDAAKAKALEFARKAGFEEMKPVWIDINGTVAFINLAPEQNGVVLYPDLIKVKIAMDDGEVLGLETTNYLLNHIERESLSATIDEDAAKSMINKKLEATNVRLALIPKEMSKEILTYEVYCDNNGLSYIIYINAQDGAEENILRVVDTEQGKLLE